MLTFAGLLLRRRWHRRGSTRSSLSSDASAVKPSAAQRASQSRKAWGVETPMGGRATTHQTGSRSGRGKTFCPRSLPRTAPPIRNSGTSEPTFSAS